MTLRALVLALALVFLGGCAALGVGEEDRVELQAEFSRAFNLFEGSTVRIAGVDVGRIDDVRVEPGGDRVLVDLSLDEGTRLPADVEAVVIQGALLGERYVQLHPPFEGNGPELDDGARVPLERTRVPVEFEEAFESLNEMLESLDRDEVARLVTNLAEVLDGQGDDLGETIEDLRDLMSALRQSDDHLVELAGTLADLNETVATRAEAMTQQFEDLGLVAESLASDRADLERTLDALVRMTDEMGDLLVTHRGTLEEDVETVTQLGRTVNRNLDEWQRFLFGQAELFRHADRIIPIDRNWMPVINHTTEEFEQRLAHRIQQRLVRLCSELELDACADVAFWDALLFGDLEPGEGGICMEPLVPCPDDGDETGTLSVPEALSLAITEVPELGEALADETEADESEQDDHALRDGSRR